MGKIIDKLTEDAENEILDEFHKALKEAGMKPSKTIDKEFLEYLNDDFWQWVSDNIDSWLEDNSDNEGE